MPSIRPSPKWSLLPKSPWQTGRIIFCTSARLGTGASRITSTPRTDQTPAMGGNRDPASEANKENSSPGIKDQGQGETSSSPATGPGRGNSETHSSMEETDRQPMDPECHTGLSPGAPGSAPRQTYPTSCDSEPRATAGSLDRSGQSNQKVGHSTNFGIERFLQPNFCGSQKGQRLAPSSEPESPQPVRAQSPLQNGKHCLLEGHNPGRRLYGTSGLEGCLPLSAHSKALLEIPAIQMGGEELQVPNAPLWPGISAKGLYKTAASSGSGNEEERRPSADLPRRYTGHGTGKGHPQERFDNGSGDPLGPGLCDQPEEVHFRALNSDRLPGLPSGHPNRRHVDGRGKDPPHQLSRVQSSLPGPPDICLPQAQCPHPDDDRQQDSQGKEAVSKWAYKKHVHSLCGRTNTGTLCSWRVHRTDQ